jgi:hypothetical protein
MDIKEAKYQLKSVLDFKNPIIETAWNIIEAKLDQCQGLETKCLKAHEEQTDNVKTADEIHDMIVNFKTQTVDMKTGEDISNILNILDKLNDHLHTIKLVIY